MKSIIKNLLFLLRHQRKWLVLFALTAGLTAVLEAIGVGAIIPFVEILQSKESVLKYNHYLSLIGVTNLNYKELLTIVAISLASIIVIKNIFMVINEHIKNIVQLVLKVSLSTTIYSNYLSADYNFFVVNPHAFLLQRITSLVDQVRAALSMLMTIVVNVGAVIFIYGVMALVSFKITLIVTLIMGIFAVITVFVSRHIAYASGKAGVVLESSLYNTTSETIAGMRIVRAFCAEDLLKHKFDKITRSLARILIINATIFTIPARAIESVFIIGLCIVIVGLSRRHDELSNVIPLLSLFGAGFIRITQRVAPIYSSVMNLSYYLPAVNVIAELIRDFPLVKKGGIKFEGLQKSIELKDISFAYPDTSEMVLDSLSIQVPKGQFIAIVGSSGGGKSTIVDLLLGLYTPTKGSIVIDEENSLWHFDLESWRTHLGLVEQNTVLFNGTVKENITFGMPVINMNKVVNAAKLANAHDFISKLPKGYDTEIGEKGLKLSGGERQRLALARAVYNDPEILILDEATSSLDSIAEKEVQNAIENIGSNRTLIVIAHRLSTITRADKIYVLMGGKVAEEVTHVELIEKQGVYWDLCQKQDLSVSKHILRGV